MESRLKNVRPCLLVSVMLAVALLHGGASKNAWSTTPTVSVVDEGADPTGQRDSAVAFRGAIESGKDVFVPHGTYRFATTEVPPCCAYDPTAVRISGLHDFRIKGQDATVVIDDRIALSSAFHFDNDKRWTIQGITIIGSRKGLRQDQENVAIALSNDRNFRILDVRIMAGYYGTGAGIAGNWDTDGLISRTIMRNVGIAGDLSGVKRLVIDDLDATGASQVIGGQAVGAGQKGLSFINDLANERTNRIPSGVSRTEDVRIRNSRLSGFQTGIVLRSGRNFDIFNNFLEFKKTRPTKDIGIWIDESDDKSREGANTINITENLLTGVGQASSSYALVVTAIGHTDPAGALRIKFRSNKIRNVAGNGILCSGPVAINIQTQARPGEAGAGGCKGQSRQ